MANGKIYTKNCIQKLFNTKFKNVNNYGILGDNK